MTRRAVGRRRAEDWWGLTALCELFDKWKPQMRQARPNSALLKVAEFLAASIWQFMVRARESLWGEMPWTPPLASFCVLGAQLGWTRVPR